jgi:hypothetical protein
MRWYRATYNQTSGKYTKAAPINVITERLGQMIGPGKQGASLTYNGMFTSTESVRDGAYVIGEDGQMQQVFTVENIGGRMTKINKYRIVSQGFIKGANG